MPVVTATMGQMMIDRALPPEMRGRNLTLDSKTIERVMQEVADKYPEKYSDVAQKLSDIGRHAATITNGYSIGLHNLSKSKAGQTMLNELEGKLDKIYASELPELEKNKQIVDVTTAYRKPLLAAVYKESLDAKNPMAMQVLSGARGNPGNINSLIGGDLMYVDYKDRPIPVPILRSYSQGLSPAEYFAGSFGARKGVIDTKTSVQQAGFFGKQLSQVAHRLVVSAKDADVDPDAIPDPDDVRGFPVRTDSRYNSGALLAHPVSGYARNTILTPKILKDIQDSGNERILVRSPTVGGPRDGGVYANDVGVRERGGIAPIGDFVGLAGAAAIAEPISQGMLSSKHCLSQGTLVCMADFGSQPIESLKPGDWVLGADMTGNTFPVKVLELFDNGLRECFDYSFKKAYTQKKDLATVTCTADHNILMLRRLTGSKQEILNWTPQLLPIGTNTGEISAIVPNRYTSDDTECIPTAGVNRHTYNALKMECEPHRHMETPTWRRTLVEPAGQLPTFDIHVDHPDHLFVLASGLIVSNSGGISGAGAGSVQGFALFNAMVQVPGTFPGGATHAQQDGRVQTVRVAPQGGQFITIAGQDHYVPADYKVKVEPGQMVEAGDAMTDGIPNPSEIVKHKGVGEGRKYFTDTFLQALEDSGTKTHRRNVELLSRSLINHVRLNEEHEDHIPGDVVPYQSLESNWKPRQGHQITTPENASNQYLERPVLHYSVGTKIRPSVIKELKHFGVRKVYAHKDPAPFSAEMIRGMGSIHEDEDWMTKMLGSYQKDSLLESTHRGAVSDEMGTSYVPALASGRTFGIAGATKGWELDDKTPNKTLGTIN